jgi:hypothetical protein
VSFLTAVKTRQQALVLLPLIQARYPAVVRDVRAGACTTLADKIELRNAVVRMLALARPPDPSPPGR